MEKKGNVIAICCIVGFLGLVATATGCLAEVKRIKHLSRSGCVHPRSLALVFGYTAAGALMTAQIIMTVATIHTWRIDGRLDRIADCLLLFVFSWLTFVLAFGLLVSGAMVSDKVFTSNFGNDYCYIVRPGVFAGGAGLSLVSVVLGIMYYLNLNWTKNRINNSFDLLAPPPPLP